MDTNSLSYYQRLEHRLRGAFPSYVDVLAHHITVEIDCPREHARYVYGVIKQFLPAWLHGTPKLQMRGRDVVFKFTWQNAMDRRKRFDVVFDKVRLLKHA